LEQVLDAVMRITHAERGFLLLADNSAEAGRYQSIAGLRLRVGRRRGDDAPLSEVRGISTSGIRKAMETGSIVATRNAAAAAPPPPPPPSPPPPAYSRWPAGRPSASRPAPRGRTGREARRRRRPPPAPWARCTSTTRSPRPRSAPTA